MTIECLPRSASRARTRGRLARGDAALGRARATPTAAHGALTEDLAVHAAAGRLADRRGQPRRAVDLAGECLLDHDPDRALDLLAESREVAGSSGNEFIAGVSAVSIASVLGRHGDLKRALRSFRDVVDRWRRTGNWMQQWTTLRNLGDLFVRLGEDELAALFHGATVRDEDVASVYGPEAARLERARRLLDERLGTASLRTLLTRGRLMTGEDCIALAAREIDRLLDAATAAMAP